MYVYVFPRHFSFTANNDPQSHTLSRSVLPLLISKGGKQTLCRVCYCSKCCLVCLLIEPQIYPERPHRLHDEATQSFPTSSQGQRSQSRTRGKPHSFPAQQQHASSKPQLQQHRDSLGTSFFFQATRSSNAFSGNKRRLGGAKWENAKASAPESPCRRRRRHGGHGQSPQTR